MAWMRVILGKLALGLVLIVLSSGCQWPGFAPAPAVSQTPLQAPTASTQTPDAQPVSPPAASKPASATDLALSPQVAALQQEVQEFVNRFPDSDLSRKVADAAKPTTIIAQRPAVDAPSTPGTPAIVIEGSDATKKGPDATARQASASPPAVPDVSPSPAGPAPIRANSPLSSDPVVRAGSPDGANPTVPKVEALEIAPVPSVAPVEPTAPKAEPNRAASAAPVPKVRDIDATIAELQKGVAERPNDVAALFRLRMLYLAEGLDDKATAPVAGLEPETGDVFADMTRTLVAVRDATRDPLNRSTAAIDQTRQLAQRLRRQAPVSIDRLALVSRVNSYGDYDEVSPAEFPAGQGARLILYAEVSNFRSEKGEGDRYRTLLGETVEVFDAKGQSVFKQVHDKIPDTCRRVRNDFFLALELALPETLAPGTYAVKATVEDKLSATADQRQLTFAIVTPKHQ